MTSNHTMTSSDDMTCTHDMISNHEMTPNHDMALSHDMTSTHDMTCTHNITPSHDMISAQNVVSRNFPQLLIGKQAKISQSSRGQGFMPYFPGKTNAPTPPTAYFPVLLIFPIQMGGKTLSPGPLAYFRLFSNKKLRKVPGDTVLC